MAGHRNQLVGILLQIRPFRVLWPLAWVWVTIKETHFVVVWVEIELEGIMNY